MGPEPLPQGGVDGLGHLCRLEGEHDRPPEHRQLWWGGCDAGGQDAKFLVGESDGYPNERGISIYM